MDIELSITLPEKVSMNKVKGMHWRQWYALAELYHNELLEVKGKIKVQEYPVEITYDFYWIKNPLDTLNTALICKLIEDGLVKAKVLVDDDTRYVRRSILSSQKSDRFKHDTVIVKICSLK